MSCGQTSLGYRHENCINSGGSPSASHWLAASHPTKSFFIPCLLTPRCRVLLEQLTGLQLVKKFPAFHGTRRFITALTNLRHPSLSWASPILSIYPHPTSWRYILQLSTHLRLGLLNGLFPSGSPPRPYTPTFPHPYAPHAQPISFFSSLSPAQYWVNYRTIKKVKPATVKPDYLSVKSVLRHSCST